MFPDAIRLSTILTEHSYTGAPFFAAISAQRVVRNVWFDVPQITHSTVSRVRTSPMSFAPQLLQMPLNLTPLTSSCTRYFARRRTSFVQMCSL
jgi:hypothetical protein